LVIDDRLLRGCWNGNLETAGYEVDTAASARGLKRVMDYGVFLVDVEMPGWICFEFIKSARADPRFGLVL
jgi:DNA-binding response OmpR family regulator